MYFLLKHITNSKSIVFIMLCLFVAVNCIAQKKIDVKSIKGFAYISEDITPRQARNIALGEAKKEALRKAGIKENISATNVLSTSQEQSNFNQNFVEISAVELNGTVLDCIITNEKRIIDEFDNFKIEITIDATVIKYETNKDQSFEFKVEGTEDHYKTNEKLTFTFTPFQDGYLKIFLISNDTSQIIYPYKHLENEKFSDVQDKIFKKYETVEFPILKWMKYSLTSKRDKEFNQLIFVFTKNNIPFKNKVTSDNMHTWIYSIPPDQRVIENIIFEIKNKEF